MNTTELIEIARECGGRYAYTKWGYNPFSLTELQQFTQRIEAPHLQRIAELEKDCEILQTNYDAARKASQFSADVADQALADLKCAEERIAQLEQVLTIAKRGIVAVVCNVPLDSATDDAIHEAMTAIKALGQNNER